MKCVEVERLDALVEFALAEILAASVVDLEPAGREGIGEDLELFTVGEFANGSLGGVDAGLVNVLDPGG